MMWYVDLDSMPKCDVNWYNCRTKTLMLGVKTVLHSVLLLEPWSWSGTSRSAFVVLDIGLAYVTGRVR